MPKFIDTLKAPVDAANVYMRDIRDDQLRAAFDEQCAELRNQGTYEDYVRRVAAINQRDGHLLRFNAHSSRTDFGHSNETTVDIDATTTHGNVPIQARMVKEDGEWRWCGAYLSDQDVIPPR